VLRVTGLGLTTRFGMTSVDGCSLSTGNVGKKLALFPSVRATSGRVETSGSSRMSPDVVLSLTFLHFDSKF
jgi:hypothetical protein